MKKSLKNPKTKELIIIAVALILLAVLVILRIYKCPLDFLFGIPCPMCGITRAYLSLLQGDIGLAFYYHPLWPVLLIIGLLYALCLLGVIHPSKKVINITGYSLCVLLIACFILRHIQGSPVVRIHFDSSLISVVLNMVKQIFGSLSFYSVSP